MRKIYLAQHNQSVFSQALELLGQTALSYRISEHWICVREEDYLRAVVLLKNHGITSEIATG